ncbi:MAG: hypothetical protein PVI86_11705 [Phycisphaerae bacterium]
MRRTRNAWTEGWLRYSLGVVVLATCLRVWIGPATILPEAQAQLPDSAKQRKQLVAETQRTNQLLLEIKTLLADQTLNVRVVGADNQAPAPAPRGSGG